MAFLGIVRTSSCLCPCFAGIAIWLISRLGRAYVSWADAATLPYFRTKERDWPDSFAHFKEDPVEEPRSKCRAHELFGFIMETLIFRACWSSAFSW